MADNRTRVDELTFELIDGANQAHLATLLPDGAPHSVPVWAGWEGAHLVFITGPDSRKARNVARDPRVCVSVTDSKNPARMAMLRGSVERIVDGAEGWAVVDRLALKYLGMPYPRRQERAAFYVAVDSALSVDLAG
jgi:PPOX class probable F420-dependent enzyme